MFDLRGRRALITGASRGIGLALARALGSAGANLVLNARSPDPLNDAADMLRADGHVVVTAPFDVTDADAVGRAVAAIEADGAIDILVNNAGLQRRGPLVEFADDDWHDLVATNLTGPFLVGRAVAAAMIPRGRGKIINIGSVQSALARPGIAPYAATKGGLKLLTQGMCADLAGHGIQVNSLAPGYLVTDLTSALADDPQFTAWLERRTPAGRWGRVDELAGAVVFLASQASDFVNGQTLFVDGGMTAVV